MRAAIALFASAFIVACGDNLEGLPAGFPLPADVNRSVEKKKDADGVRFVVSYAGKTLSELDDLATGGLQSAGWKVSQVEPLTYVVEKDGAAVSLSVSYDETSGGRLEVAVPAEDFMLEKVRGLEEEKAAAKNTPAKPIANVPTRVPGTSGATGGAKIYFDILARDCDGGSSADCWLLGVAHAGGMGGLAKDPARAAALWKKGCDPKGEATACVDHYRPNKVIAAGELAVLAKLCGQGRADACKLAVVHSGGKPGKKLQAAACAAGILDHCLTLRPAPKDATAGPALKAPPKATALAKQAVAQCNKRAGFACSLLALGYNGGLYGLPRDPARAVEIGKRACHEKSVWGCYPTAAAAFGLAKTPNAMAAALAFAQTGCERMEPQSCSLLASVFERVDTQPLRLHALHYRLSLCHGGLPDGNPCADFERSVAAYPGAVAK